MQHAWKLALLVAVLTWATVHGWRAHRVAHPQELAGLGGPGEFVAAAMPEGTQADTVLILAPVHCPSAAAKRADALAEQLSSRGVPVVRSNSARLTMSRDPQARAGIEHAKAVLEGEIPAVFVNGLGKANPSVEETLAAFDSTRRH